MKSVSKSILVGVFLILAAAFASAQFTQINPPPCDFSDQFYADNGLVSAATTPPAGTGELDTEPDGRFGNVINGHPVRQTGPPATGSQQNWVNDPNCTNDPTRRNVRILATTGGNSDNGNSPFSCADVENSNTPVPDCINQPGIPETLEFISILAFIHAEPAFETTDSRFVGNIGPNGGLDGVQTNPGTLLSISSSANPRGIRMEDIVSNFEAYANLNQFSNTLKCPAGATLASQCTPAPGNFANAPCSVQMINNLQDPNAHTLPTFCFNVADTTDSGGNTVSDVASPKLRNNWRFATNRNAMDGSDNNCINNTDGQCAHISDSPYGYFCDDLLGMWIITYFWFTQAPTLPQNPTQAQINCHNIYQAIGAGTKEPDPNHPGQFINVPGNGFGADGFPIVMTANELNNQLEGNGCGAEGQEDPAGSDHGAAWLVCPAIPDPRNGAITSDAFLDVNTHGSLLDPFVSNNFTCLQQTGKFCFESSVE